jgi:hypothetical protein
MKKLSKIFSNMSVKFDYSFGELSEGGYRMYPLLFFAHGTNGFVLCILGASATVKLW